MIRIALLLLSALSAGSLEPMLFHKNGRITASPPKTLAVKGQNIEILQSINCNGRVESTSSITVPEKCGYLHGLYRYIFTSTESPSKRQALVDFSLTKNKRGEETFLVGESITIDQRDTPLNPVQ